MNFAYLMNSYPMTSTTFIRREIEAHERNGVSIVRFAIRPWDQKLVDPADIAESKKVFYLLSGGIGRLTKAFLKELVTNPARFVRALRATVTLTANASAGRFKNFAYLLEATLLRRECSARNIKHLHVHFSTNSTAVAMLSYLLGGPAYSFTVHGPDELLIMEENSLNLKMHYAKFVVAITGYCRSVLEEHSKFRYSKKIHIVRCGVELISFGDPSPVPPNHNLIVVGRLCKQKAQSLLVEAVAPLKDSYPDLRIQMIGDGEDRPLIEQRIVDLDLKETIHLVGWKSNSDVRRSIAASRALVLASLAEGLPIVIMESFALGRPVLSTSITGIPELVDDSCGWLVPPGSVKSLTAALDALLKAEVADLTEMGAVGRNRVETQYDQDTNAQALRDLIIQDTS